MDFSCGRSSRHIPVSLTEFLSFQTKNCFVLLERLDKEVLDRYLGKGGSDLENVAKEPRKRGKVRPRLAKRPSKTAEGYRERRRKIRAKPLRYTEDEDEDEFSSANTKENISEKTTGDSRSPSLLNEHPKPDIGANHDETLNGGKKATNGREKKESIPGSFLKDSSNKTVDAVESRAVRNFPEKMDPTGSKRSHDLDSGRVKEEAEESRESASFKRESKWEEEDKQSECTPAHMGEFDDGENDSRDEDEDDRATIVFDESFNEGASHLKEVFEKAEEKAGSATKKFHKKRIINRKKKTLVKFKRKRSLIGRNLAKVRKLKNKNWEVSGSGEQPAQKESDSGSNVGELRGLVKRLRELYRIILQLQKAPMDAEQADYFIRTIKAQQENFDKEIKKSEKSIMRGYDKLLSAFGNASTVSVEIGERTSLGKEDIADVTSGANLQEVGPPQSPRMERSAKEGLGNIFNHSGKEPAPGSGSEGGTADPVVTPHSQSVQSSGHRHPPKSLRRPNNEPDVAKKAETRGNHSTEHFFSPGPSSSSRVSRPLQDNNPVQWFDVSKPRAHVGPRENFPRRTHVAHRESRFMQLPQQGPRYMRGNQVRPHPSRPAHSHLSNVRAPYGGGSFPIHGNGTPPFNHRPINNNVEFFQASDGFVPPALLMAEPAPRVRVQSLMGVNPFPFGYSQGRSPPHHSPQVPNSCSLPPGIRLASGPHFDRSKQPPQTNRSQNNFGHSSKSFGSFQRPNGFPSSKSSECKASSAPGQTFPREGQGQCFLRSALTSFPGFPQSNTPTQTYPATEPSAHPEQTRRQVFSISTDPAGTSVAPESCVLDPTVPQKLTMRNCRLEAGPILKPKNEVVTSEGGGKPRQESAGRAEASKQKELNSRVYVCAQYGCKNPGVRICKGCTSVIYCSETCQLKHWTRKHKKECHQLKELRG